MLMPSSYIFLRNAKQFFDTALPAGLNSRNATVPQHAAVLNSLLLLSQTSLYTSLYLQRKHDVLTNLCNLEAEKEIQHRFIRFIQFCTKCDFFLFHCISQYVLVTYKTLKCSLSFVLETLNTILKSTVIYQSLSFLLIL